MAVLCGERRRTVAQAAYKPGNAHPPGGREGRLVRRVRLPTHEGSVSSYEARRVCVCSYDSETEVVHFVGEFGGEAGPEKIFRFGQVEDLPGDVFGYVEGDVAGFIPFGLCWRAVTLASQQPRHVAGAIAVAHPIEGVPLALCQGKLIAHATSVLGFRHRPSVAGRNEVSISMPMPRRPATKASSRSGM